MLTLFPSLLSFSFFVPAGLRIAAALFLGYQAGYHFTHKKRLAPELERRFGWLAHSLTASLIMLLVLFEAGAGVLLFVGAWTQLVALLSAAGFLKMAYFSRAIPDYAPLARSTYLLLAVICLAIVIMGAGAFAFDLPL